MSASQALDRGSIPRTRTKTLEFGARLRTISVLCVEGMRRRGRAPVEYDGSIERGQAE